MSDELECFRKAAELGCPDFELDDGEVRFAVPSCFPSPMVMAFLPHDNGTKHSKRINRYASAVCAEWWAEYGRFNMDKPHVWDHAEVMVSSARAFGRKYGAA